MRQRSRGWGKPGNFALMMPAVIMVLMGVGAFVFDLGYVSLSRSRIQNATDAAALAAAKKLNGTTAGVTAARNEALAIINLNDPGHELAFSSTQDVVFGYWSETLQTFDTSASVALWNAVRVTAQRTTSRGNPLQPFFARIFGVNSMDISGQTTAFMKASYGDPTDTTGVPGGHFDIDTDHNISTLRTSCSSAFSCGDMNTDGHVHEYDNEFSSISYDARSPGEVGGSKNPGTLHSIQADTSGKGSFKIIVANANLSPGINIIINGVSRRITEYAALPYASLPTYTSDTLTELRLSVAADAIETRSLHRTQPDCVWYNRAGAEGEWRNGALTIQAISTTGTISATIPVKGGQGVAASGLLHEMMMFWHGPGSCYHEAPWEAEWDSIGTRKSHLIR